MMLICPHSGLGNQIGNYVFAQFLIDKGFKIKFLVTEDENLDRAFVLNKFNTCMEFASIEDIKAFIALNPQFSCYKYLFNNVLFNNKAYFNSLYKVLARIRAEYGLYPSKNPAFLSKILSYKDILKYSLNQGAVCDCYSPIPEFNNENFKEKIKRHFILKEPPDEKNFSVMQKIKSVKNPAGVHIRRGDYLSLKIPVVKKEFITEKIKYINENLDGVRFFIFSDDINWAKKHLKTLDNIEFVDINDEAHGYLDFALMNECKHRIYSASSFSKWLQYLNPHPDTFEYFPKKQDLTIEN